MKPVGFTLAAITLGFAGLALAAPKSKARKPAPAPEAAAPEAASRPPRPPARLPSPIDGGRIHLEISPEHLRITSDIVFIQGEWAGDDFRVHVAYGAPAVPLAFEAWLCNPSNDEMREVAESCVPLPHATAVRAAPDAAFVFGPATMAGEEIEIAAEALGSLFGADRSAAILRLRTLRALPTASATGEREVLIRLGRGHVKAQAISSLEIEATEGATLGRVEARLCGPEAKNELLPLSSKASGGPGAKSLVAQRTGREDLCVRFGP